MAHCPQEPSSNFTEGRDCEIQGIVLHGFDGSLNTLTQLHNMNQSYNATGCHASYHYGIEGCQTTQFIDVANTAWSFGDDPATSACQPVDWPVADANPDIDPDCYTINIAVSWGAQYDHCDAVPATQIACLGAMLCDIIQENGLTFSPDLIWPHNNELPPELVGPVCTYVEDCLNDTDEQPGPPISDLEYCDGTPVPNGGAVAGCGTIGTMITNCAGDPAADGDSFIGCDELGDALNILNITNNNGDNIDWNGPPCLVTCEDLAGLPIGNPPNVTDCSDRALDITDPDTPVALATCADILTVTPNVTTCGGEVLDITNPDAAVALATCADLLAITPNVETCGGEVLDITNPDTPVALATCADLLAVTPNVVDCNDKALDLTNPDTPVALATCADVLAVTPNVETCGGEVLNITDPDTPVALATCADVLAVTPNVMDCFGEVVDITNPDTPATILTCANAAAISASIQDCSGAQLGLFNPAVINQLVTCADIVGLTPVFLADCTGTALDTSDSANPVQLVTCADFTQQLTNIGITDCNGNKYDFTDPGNVPSFASCADITPVFLEDCAGNALDPSDSANPLAIVTCAEFCTPDAVASGCGELGIMSVEECQVKSIAPLPECLTLQTEAVTTVSLGIDPADSCSLKYQQVRQHIRTRALAADEQMDAQTDHIGTVDASGGNISVRLPDMTNANCYWPTDFYVKRIDNVTANTVTVNGAGANIDGQGNVVLQTPSAFTPNMGEAIHVVWDGTQWLIV